MDGIPLAPAGPDEIAGYRDRSVSQSQADSRDRYLPPQPRSLEDSGFWKASTASRDAPP
jgi:hypothetical protein